MPKAGEQTRAGGQHFSMGGPAPVGPPDATGLSLGQIIRVIIAPRMKPPRKEAPGTKTPFTVNDA